MKHQHSSAPGLVPAAAAAARLGVKPATLYAYVSRGLLRPFAVPGRRGSWFDPLQLDTLGGRARRPAERRPDVRIASAITRIDGTRYWYRGADPATLAATRRFEQVAEWLWRGVDDPHAAVWRADPAAVAAARHVQRALPKVATPFDRLRVVVSVLGVMDPLRDDRRPAGALATARRLIASSLAAVTTRARGPVAAQAAAWIGQARVSQAAIEAVDDVLVLMADHELAASTVAVRVAASFGADPYAAVGAGLGAMSGALHGAASRRLEYALASMREGQRAAAAAGTLLADPAHVPGFGHPLYPQGDPRVAPILALASALGTARARRTVEALLSALRDQGVPPPNVDFALAAFTHAIGASPGAGEALFTVGRLAGWLAHAMEEYAERTDFRLRAVYTGPRPA